MEYWHQRLQCILSLVFKEWFGVFVSLTLELTLRVDVIPLTYAFCKAYVYVYWLDIIVGWFTLYFVSNLSSYFNCTTQCYRHKSSSVRWRVESQGRLYSWDLCHNPGLHTLCRILKWYASIFSTPYINNKQKQLASSLLYSCVDDPSLFWLHYSLNYYCSRSRLLIFCIALISAILSTFNRFFSCNHIFGVERVVSMDRKTCGLSLTFLRYVHYFPSLRRR